MKKISLPALAVVVGIALFLVGYWYLIVPEAGKIGVELSNIAQRDADLKLAAPTVAAVPTTTDVLNQEVLFLLPANDDQYDLAVQIEALSRGQGIPLSSMTISGAEVNLGAKTSTSSEDGSSSTSSSDPASAAGGGMKKLTVAIGASGSYQDIQRFVLALGQINRIIQIDQISLTASSGAAVSGAMSGGTPVTAQIVLYAYYLPLTAGSATSQ